jgi:hypothetical protein
MAEASMIAAPTVSPPSGTYALSLSTPTNVASNCMINQGFGAAWDCDLVGSPALAISVGVPAAPRPTEGAFFFYASSDPGWQYGAQYKYMDTDFSTYQPVQESGEEDKGPAYYFGQTYDKIVLLPETAFPKPSGGSSRNKRDFQLPNGWNKQRQAINHGEKPWMCIWNNTLIEGWIYVEQNITSSFPITTSSSLLSTPTANSTPPENTVSTYTTPTATSAVDTGPRAQFSPTTIPTAITSSGHTTLTTTIVQVSTTTPDSWTKNRGPPPGVFDDDDHESSETGDGISRKRQLERRQSSADYSSVINDHNDDEDDDEDDDGILTPEQEEALDTYHGLPPYPYLIKIEERRIPEEGNTPYCQQFQLLDNGELSPYSDPANPTGIKFEIAEQPPAYSAYDDNMSIRANLRTKKRDPSTNACHCEWWAE